MPRTFVWHPTRGPKKTEPNTLTKGKVRIEQVRCILCDAAILVTFASMTGFFHVIRCLMNCRMPSPRPVSRGISSRDRKYP